MYSFTHTRLYKNLSGHRTEINNGTERILLKEYVYSLITENTLFETRPMIKLINAPMNITK